MILSVASGQKSKQNTPSAVQAIYSTDYDSDKSIDVIIIQIKVDDSVLQTVFILCATHYM
jgi:hypothetical protein